MAQVNIPFFLERIGTFHENASQLVTWLCQLLLTDRGERIVIKFSS